MRYLATLLFLMFVLTSGAQGEDSVKILSWNVFLRPGILHDHQLDRVDSIAKYLSDTDADVLVLQEVFHRKSRKKLIGYLKEKYPFFTSMGPKSFFRIPSGVVILSKDSIVDVDRVSFRKSTGADRLAKKGAVCVTIHRKEHDFHVIGTHLQAGGGEKGALIRKHQLHRIHKLATRKDSLDPIVFAGDFNISFGTEAYSDLIDSLQTKTKKPRGKFRSTANFNDQELFSTSGKPKWIDFIFLHNRKNAEIEETWIEEPRLSAENDHERLSDHNPILSIVKFDFSE